MLRPGACACSRTHAHGELPRQFGGVVITPLASERRSDLLNKLLQLGYLVSPNQADAQISHACSLVALQRIDDQVGRAQPHKPAIMDAAAVVLLQKRARQGFGLSDIGVEAHKRITVFPFVHIYGMVTALPDVRSVPQAQAC